MEKTISSGAEEYVLVLFELAESLGPAPEKAVTDALSKLSSKGINSLQIDQERISVCYDPTILNKATLETEISEAGGKIKHAETDRAPYLS